MARSSGKLEIVKQLQNCASFGNCTQKFLILALETILDLLICYFQNGGEQIILKGFGTFRLRVRKAHKGTHPQTLEQIEIPRQVSIGFKPGAEVLRRLNAGSRFND